MKAPRKRCRNAALQKRENIQVFQRFRRYENLGFEVITEMYLEDEIPHYGMIFEVNKQVR